MEPGRGGREGRNASASTSMSSSQASSSSLTPPAQLTENRGRIRSKPNPAGTAYVLNTNTKKFTATASVRPVNRTDYRKAGRPLLDPRAVPCTASASRKNKPPCGASAHVAVSARQEEQGQTGHWDRMGKKDVHQTRRRRLAARAAGDDRQKPRTHGDGRLSDQRTDQTSRGQAGSQGETGKTGYRPGGKAAQPRLYSSIHVGRMPQASNSV